MNDWAAFLPVIGIVILAAGLWPFVRGKSTQATIDLLKSELAVERDARLEQDRRCVAEINELRGQLRIVTREFAVTIGRQVVQAIRDDGLDTGDRGGR